MTVGRRPLGAGVVGADTSTASPARLPGTGESLRRRPLPPVGSAPPPARFGPVRDKEPVTRDLRLGPVLVPPVPVEVPHDALSVWTRVRSIGLPPAERQDVVVYSQEWW